MDVINENINESDIRFQSVFNCSPISMSISSIADNTYLEVNKEFENLTGYKREEVINKPVYGMNIYHSTRERQKLIDEMLQNKKIDNREINFSTKTKEIKTGLFAMTPIKFNDQDCILTTVIDITDRKKRIQYENAINDCVSVLVNEQEYYTAICQILEKLKDTTKADRVYIFQNNNTLFGTNVSLKYEVTQPGIENRIHNSSMKNMEYKIIDPDGRLQKMMAENSPFYGPVNRLSESEKKIILTNQVADILILPIMAGNEIWGFIGFDDLFSERRWQKIEINLLNSIVKSMGLYIHRKKTEQRLTDSEKFHRLLVDTMPDSLIVCDLNGNIEYTSKRAKKVFGNNISGTNIFDYIEKEEILIARNNMQNMIINKKEQAHSYHITTNENKKYTVECAASVITDKYDEPEKFLILVRDITEKEELEMKLIHAQKMEAIGTLAGGIAHDFNNILCGLIGYSEIILNDKRMHDDLKEYMKNILAGSRRARDLVKNILTFSRKNNFQKKPFAISEVIDEAIQLAKASIPKNIIIRLKMEYREAIIFGDRSQIGQVVMNLITNAYQAVIDKLEGEIIVVIKRFETDNKRCFSYKNYAKIAVTDNGAGIEKKNLSRIFEPYFTTKEQGKGTGLGLAIVHGIVKNHGGEIFVESQVGIGTTFTVYLPLASSVYKTESANTTAMTKIFDHQKILVLDDELSLVSSIKTGLEKIGLCVNAFTDYRQALDDFTLNHKTYSLVITDQSMPNMTGVDFIQILKKINDSLPMVIYTGHSDVINANNFRNYGAAALWEKPLSIMDEMVPRIKELIC